MAVKRKRRRSKRRRARRASFFASNPIRRRRRRRAYAMNPRRRRRRSYRRNPPAFRSLGNELLYAGVGFMGTKVIGNFVTPMLGMNVSSQPIMRIGLKVAVAYVAAFALEKVMGSRVFVPAFIGGSMEAVSDAVKTFIAPSFPMLAAYDDPLGIYVEPRALPMPPRRLQVGEYMHANLNSYMSHDLGDS